MKKTFIVTSIAFLLLLFSATALDSGCAYYFYAQGCEECAALEPSLTAIENSYPTLQIEKFEVYYNPDNAKVLEEYFTAFNVPKHSQGIPVLFLEDAYLVGNSSITEFLPSQLQEKDIIACPTTNTTQAVGIVGEKEEYNVLSTLSFGIVTGAGLKDSIRPVMIAVLLITLALLSGIRSEDKIAMNGAILSVILFVITVFAGVGLLPFLPERVAFYFYRIMGFVIIVIGIIKIKGFLSTWRALLKNVPEKMRENAIKAREHLISPIGIVIISIIAGLLSTADKPAVAHLLHKLFAQGLYNSVVFPLILYYSLITILPVIIIVVALYQIKNHLYDEVEEEGKEKKKSSDRIEKLKTYYHRLVNFSASIVMITLGVILLFV